MLSSHEYLKHFLWKYIDFTINEQDIQVLKSNIVPNKKWFDVLIRFKNNYALNDNDLHNYAIVLSQMNDNVFKLFMIFYMINVCKYVKNSEKNTITSIEELGKYLNEDEKRFEILLISLYYYF